VRVASDAPLGNTLRNSIMAAGRIAVDATEVGERRIRNSASAPRPQAKNVILRKSSDRQEVRPGDTVRYSIFVKNTLGHVIRNVRVEDRMDTSYSAIVDARAGVMSGDRIVWDIPRLEPGEGWEVSYTARVSSGAPHGMEIANVVSVQGEGLERISLTERVRTSSIGVITKLPSSGVPMDLLLAGLMMILSAVATRKQLTLLR